MSLGVSGLSGERRRKFRGPSAGFWAAWGASWSLLGRLLEPLGAIQGDPGRILERLFGQSNFREILD